MTRLPRLLPLLLLPVVLAGCSSRSGDLGSTGGLFNPGLVSSLEARGEGPLVRTNHPALASLPPAAGRVVTVRHRDMANGVVQQIVLAGDAGTRGENRIDLVMRTEAAGERFDNLVELIRPTQAVVDREMIEAFPNVAMSPEPYLLRNGHGSYGVATGSAGGMNCIYAWQYVDDLDSPNHRTSILRAPVETSLRIRLCRSDMSREALLDSVRGLSYGPSASSDALLASADGGGDLLGEPATPSPKLFARTARRTSSFEGYGTPPTGRSAVAERRSPARSRPAPAARQAASPQAAPPVQQVPAMPAMPGAPGLAPQPPGSAGYGMAYGVPQAVAPAGQARAYPQGAYPQAYQQPGGAAPGVAYGAPAAVPRRLDPSLPAQAYRGPNGANPPNGMHPPQTRPAVSPY